MCYMLRFVKPPNALYYLFIKKKLFLFHLFIKVFENISDIYTVKIRIVYPRELNKEYFYGNNTS